MLTITAIIRTKAGHEGEMRDALLKVAANVADNEPDTKGFFISEDLENPGVFTTYERFTDQAAMDRHNGSDTVAAFFAVAQPLLDGEVILKTCREVSANLKD